MPVPQVSCNRFIDRLRSVLHPAEEPNRFARVLLAPLGRDDANPTSLPRAGLSANHDLDILVERRQQVH